MEGAAFNYISYVLRLAGMARRSRFKATRGISGQLVDNHDKMRQTSDNYIIWKDKRY